MPYEFFAILKDGTEHSIIGDDVDQVSKAGQAWLVENFDNFHSSTIYMPHENVEWAKKLSRDSFAAKQAKLSKKK